MEATIWEVRREAGVDLGGGLRLNGEPQVTRFLGNTEALVFADQQLDVARKMGATCEHVEHDKVVSEGGECRWNIQFSKEANGTLTIKAHTVEIPDTMFP
jgi:hypothetical protein